MKSEEKPNVYHVPKGYDSKIVVKGLVAFKTLLLWLDLLRWDIKYPNILILMEL